MAVATVIGLAFAPCPQDTLRLLTRRRDVVLAPRDALRSPCLPFIFDVLWQRKTMTNLNTRAWISLAGLVVVLALLLFIPAGRWITGKRGST